MKQAAGTLLISELTGRVLLLKRSELVGSYPHTWAIVGGGVDEGETPLEAAKRELNEETEIDPDKVEFEFFEKQEFENKDFYFFIGYVEEELGVIINDESTDWGWFELDALPEPLFPTTFSSLQRIFG